LKTTIGATSPQICKEERLIEDISDKMKI